MKLLPFLWGNMICLVDFPTVSYGRILWLPTSFLYIDSLQKKKKKKICSKRNKFVSVWTSTDMAVRCPNMMTSTPNVFILGFCETQGIFSLVEWSFLEIYSFALFRQCILRTDFQAIIIWTRSKEKTHVHASKWYHFVLGKLFAGRSIRFCLHIYANSTISMPILIQRKL